MPRHFILQRYFGSSLSRWSASAPNFAILLAALLPVVTTAGSSTVSILFLFLSLLRSFRCLDLSKNTLCSLLSDRRPYEPKLHAIAHLVYHHWPRERERERERESEWVVIVFETYRPYLLVAPVRNTVLRTFDTPNFRNSRTILFTDDFFPSNEVYQPTRVLTSNEISRQRERESVCVCVQEGKEATELWGMKSREVLCFASDVTYLSTSESVIKAPTKAVSPPAVFISESRPVHTAWPDTAEIFSPSS